jgi:hypothetical protein
MEPRCHQNESSASGEGSPFGTRPPPEATDAEMSIGFDRSQESASRSLGIGISNGGKLNGGMETPNE